jgi:acyl transferase domain-containing protein
MKDIESTEPPEGIAVVGLAGRFPGARNVEEFWRNLCEGRESVREFTDEELLASGFQQGQLSEPGFVRGRAVLDEADLFDNEFFGVTPKDAAITDPQHRVFMEVAWSALEDAGLNPAASVIGIFAGCGMNTYCLNHVLRNEEAIRTFLQGFQAEGYPILIGSDKDYLATRVAYKFGLRGPAITVQTACSSSLVAVGQAVAALNTYQCDAALAGGVSISFPQERGYVHQEGAIASADGHCRAFDAGATGTVFGSGCGVVVLKRLADAIAERDYIYGVIRSVAVNNDGSEKVSFAAPSVRGQAEVITMAHALAGVSAESISYVEAHGTATTLGDPIEIAALTQAFRTSSARTGYCGIGTAKTNIGHLESAAGIAGLIKTLLALKYRRLPPSLNFVSPNPQIDFAASPFFMVTKLTEWSSYDNYPLRAGVSSFGVGGTNAHAVVEEAPAVASQHITRDPEVLLLSARSQSALATMALNLATRLECNADSQEKGFENYLANTAFTLQTGRKSFPHRRVVVAASIPEAVRLLREDSKGSPAQSSACPGPCSGPVFTFPGQASQYLNMGRELYERKEVFRTAADDCFRVLDDLVGYRFRDALFNSAELSTDTGFVQPAILTIEYALAQTWLSWGIQPVAMTGHSLGEFSAAVIANVLSLEDALELVAKRALLMRSLPAGKMLSVRLPHDELQAILHEIDAPPEGHACISGVNSPQNCVVSGTSEAISGLRSVLKAKGVPSTLLPATIAFHSAMVDPVLEPFEALVRGKTFRPAMIPIVSTLTGKWLEPSEMSEPGYWVRQLREAVRFSDAISLLATDLPGHPLLEVGPGITLSSLAGGHPARKLTQMVISTMPGGKTPEQEGLYTAVGKLWIAGCSPDWPAMHSVRDRRKVPLPAYAFQRNRCWVDPEPAEKPISITGDPVASSMESIVLGQLAVMRQQLKQLSGEAA